jgi:hypothetical protein
MGIPPPGDPLGIKALYSQSRSVTAIVRLPRAKGTHLTGPLENTNPQDTNTFAVGTFARPAQPPS